jgi:hypothetical protein
MTKREAPIQRAIVDYLRTALPADCVVHHCRNEINKRGGHIARELAEAKRLGAVAGFPDLIVLTAPGALFFEVKAEGSYASKAQKDMHERLGALGFPVAVVRSVDDVREWLAEWGVVTVETRA